MKHAPALRPVPSRPDIERVNAIAQSLRLWAVEVVAWLAGLIGVKFRPDIREEVHAAKLCVFLNAVARCPRRGRAIRAGRARAAPVGVRFQRQRGALRSYTRGVKSGGVKIRGIHQLRALLDDMEPAIAAMVKRLARYSVVVRPVAFAPPAHALASVAAERAPAPADTS